MTDLVKRLRSEQEGAEFSNRYADLVGESAERIEALEAEVARLTEAKGAPAAVYWQNKAKEAESRLTAMTANAEALAEMAIRGQNALKQVLSGKPIRDADEIIAAQSVHAAHKNLMEGK